MVTYLGHHWLRYWLAPWQHQAIIWANDNLSVSSSTNHLSYSTIPVQYLTPCGLDMPYGDISRSSLAHILACDLTAPSHYGIHLRAISQWDTSKLLFNNSENWTFKITTASPRGPWVKQKMKTVDQPRSVTAITQLHRPSGWNVSTVLDQYWRQDTVS